MRELSATFTRTVNWTQYDVGEEVVCVKGPTRAVEAAQEHSVSIGLFLHERYVVEKFIPPSELEDTSFIFLVGYPYGVSPEYLMSAERYDALPEGGV